MANATQEITTPSQVTTFSSIAAWNNPSTSLTSGAPLTPAPGQGGIFFGRMTTAQRDLAFTTDLNTFQDGVQIYNTDTDTIQVILAQVWADISTDTNSSINVIGPLADAATTRAAAVTYEALARNKVVGKVYYLAGYGTNNAAANGLLRMYIQKADTTYEWATISVTPGALPATT